MIHQFSQDLAQTIATIKDPKLADAFLRNILTPSEHEEIAKRLQIFKELLKGRPQREVADKLGASIGTVSRGAREIKYGAPGIIKLFK